MNRRRVNMWVPEMDGFKMEIIDTHVPQRNVAGKYRHYYITAIHEARLHFTQMGKYIVDQVQDMFYVAKRYHDNEETKKKALKVRGRIFSKEFEHYLEITKFDNYH